jgi:RNA polymerase sigma-32 factor
LNDRTKTLEELGARFGISRERVRQIEERALAKIRASVEKLIDETTLRPGTLSRAV